MSLSLQEYYDYLAGIGLKPASITQVVKQADKAPVKVIKPKTFTSKKR